MGNSIKYSEGSESLALNKGNWWIGTGDTNKGPTAESGYWNAINPPSGGYTVYLNKESNGPSIHSISNDEQLISFTNKISGNNYVNVAECLVYYQTQDDKLCVNREIENIVTDGLVLNLDAGYAPSYPTSGTTWYDLSGNGNNGSLVNGTIFSGGSMVFDGVNDYVDCSDPISLKLTTKVTLESWCYFTSWGRTGIDTLVGRWGNSAKSYKLAVFSSSGRPYIDVSGNGFTDNYLTSNTVLNLNVWNHVVGVYDKTSLSIYINGNNMVGTLTGTIPLLLYTGNSKVYVGDDQVNKMNGSISLASIYNRALTPQEVLQNYNALKGRFGL